MIRTLSPPKFDRRTALNAAGLLVLCVLVAPFVLYAFPGLVGAQQSYVVLSGSMEPAISTGDVVLVAPVADPSSLAVGDVITFDRGGDIPTTHRVVDVVTTDGRLAFETKGDANSDPDPGLVRPAQVIGTVVLTIPYVGYVIDFASTTTGFVLLVVIPFVILGSFEVRDALLARDRDRRAKGEGEDETDRRAEGEGEDETGVGDDETGVGDADTEEMIPPAADDDPSLNRSEEATADAGLTFSGAELTLGIAAFGAFAVYAGYVAYVSRTPVSFAVLAAVVGTVVLLSAVRFRSFGTVAQPLSTDGGVATRVIDGEFHVAGNGPIVVVDSRSALHEMAVADDRWIVRDGDVEYLFGDDVVFCADVIRSDGAADSDDIADIADPDLEWPLGEDR